MTFSGDKGRHLQVAGLFEQLDLDVGIGLGVAPHEPGQDAVVGGADERQGQPSGLAVAQTVGAEVVEPHAVSVAVVIAALLAASAWDIVTWYGGLPVSSSHALLGGIVGAAAAESGAGAIRLDGVLKVVGMLVVSPVLGFVAALLTMHALRWLLRDARPAATSTAATTSRTISSSMRPG